MRNMPKLSHLKSPSSLHPRRKWQSSRSRSTLQEIDRHNDNERTASILHASAAQQKSKAPKQKAASINPPQQKPPPRPATISSLDSNYPHGRFENSPTNISQRYHGNKRKAAPHPEQRPAQRSRRQDYQGSRALKDEAYIRRTMHVPTAQDYPQVPLGIFKTPKESIVNGIQGLATMRSNFVELTKDVWRCTLFYDSASRNDVVEAEGRSKVCLISNTRSKTDGS